jgi:glycosyltransferase involved in cell wall biosynthesis
LHAWINGAWADGWIKRRLAWKKNSAVILTVAHGDLAFAAARIARWRNLPVVTIFHDWWPDIPNVHSPIRWWLEQNFRELYQRSTVALCISEGMIAALGSHPHAYVLNAIPERVSGDATTTSVPANARKPFKVLYFGNLFEYGPILADALKLLADDESIRLEIRGNNPEWPEHFRESMRARGLLKDFAPRVELDAWLHEADAFLVVMGFETHLRRRMETSFPSKLIEYTQLGKPIVIWGPEYCSAVRWAREGARAACVTDRDPAVLREILKSLALSVNEQERLAAAARQAAEGDFNPDRIQAQFERAIEVAAMSQRA